MTRVWDLYGKKEVSLKLEEINFSDGKFTDGGGKPVDVVPVNLPRVVSVREAKSFIEAFNKSLKFEDARAEYFLRGEELTVSHELDRFHSMTTHYHPVQLYRKL